MARPYSNDLRERAAATASGRSCREVAVLFDVSVASVVKCRSGSERRGVRRRGRPDRRTVRA
jgi:transposase